MVRFNDLMQTVLAAESRSGLSAVTLWRQCVDLLAQHDRPDRNGMADEERDLLLDRLSTLRPQLSEAQRIATVVELGRRLRSPALICFFADDRPSVAAAAIARAQLPDLAWAEILQHLTPTARGVLRGRRDIGPYTRKALEAFGSADLVLTAAPQDQDQDDGALLLTEEAMPDLPMAIADDVAFASSKIRAPGRDGDQIRNLVDRIAEFTSNRRPVGETRADDAARDDAPRSFAFETDASGAILWVDQGPRAALIGLTLGEAALEGGSGPDGHVAGAFARRSGFQNGRFSIIDGVMTGEWRMSAVPFFDAKSGRFQGFRGEARRPYLHEVAARTTHVPTEIAGLSADSLRQLVHELRTPLNAILGFAEIIEQELFGAVGTQYREMAENIAVDARHLLVAFEDLDLAARVSRGDGNGAPKLIDPDRLVTQVIDRFREQGGLELPTIDIAIASDLPQILVDPVQGERMVQHLLRTMVSVAARDEAVTGTCWLRPDAGHGCVVLAVDRPSALNGLEEGQLLDPGYSADGNWVDGPLLGLGFSLRLIRSLASACGGSLEIEARRMILNIPVAGRSSGAVDIG
jgi:hypothetical protein